MLKMKEKSYQLLYNNLLSSVLNGGGQSSPEQRQAAFDNTGLPMPLSTLIGKVAQYAYKVTDNDIDMAKQTGYNDDQLFELIIASAVGEASRQYESGLAALAEAIQEGGTYASWYFEQWL